MGVAFDLNSSGSAASHLLLDAFLAWPKTWPFSPPLAHSLNRTSQEDIGGSSYQGWADRWIISSSLVSLSPTLNSNINSVLLPFMSFAHLTRTS